MSLPTGITEKTNTGTRRIHPNLFSTPHNNAVNPKNNVKIMDTKNVNPTPVNPTPVNLNPDESQ